MKDKYDKIIIGAGLYGLYAALYSLKRGERVLVLEYDAAPFSRATYVNQARVHMGYHYPRSLTTAMKSAGYFRRFEEDYGFCIHSRFDQVYATSGTFSWTNAEQFREFCRAAGIRCDDVPVSGYFRKGMCDGAFLTEEYTYDAGILRDYFMEKCKEQDKLTLLFQARIVRIIKGNGTFQVVLEDNSVYEAAYVLNASYASVNQILNKVEGLREGEGLFHIKYELCEIILCQPSEPLRNIGITVMDGPFFSIMPFGRTGLHSLTSVTFTPHATSRDSLPEFPCQRGTECSKEKLENCRYCLNRPASAWPYMSHLADKYLKDQYAYTYEKSLYSMKPILKSSEIDDSRPTAIKISSEDPVFISVLSGKINTVYDLDAYL